MKKALCVAFAILLLFLNGCSDNSPRAFYRSLIDSEQPVYTIYPIYMYTQNGLYSVVVTENGALDKAVSYSEDREPQNILLVQLAEIENIQSFLGENLNEIEDALGEYHVDIGSGFFIPSYLTVDGYLVSFTISDNICLHIVIIVHYCFLIQAVTALFLAQIIRRKKTNKYFYTCVD